MKYDYRYIPPTESGTECIEFDLVSFGIPTTAVVSARLLIDGFTAFPCGNGDDVILSGEQRVEMLEFLEAERKKTCNTGFKTLEGWRNSAYGSFLDYAQPGDMVEEGIVDYFMNVLPPRSMKHGYLQMGEPYCDVPDDKGLYRTVYITFYKKDFNHWHYAGLCFAGETENRVSYQNEIQRAKNAMADKTAERKEQATDRGLIEAEEEGESNADSKL